MTKKMNFSNAYTRYGPLIATFLIVLAGHSPIIILDTLRFLQGLITPSIIFPMLALMVIASVVGYAIGIIPVYITWLVFEKKFAMKLPSATAFQALLYGVYAGLIWTPFLLLSFIDIKIFYFGLAFCGLIILPTSAICGWLEWRKLQKQENTLPSIR